MKKLWKYFVGFLILVVTTIWLAIAASPDSSLHIIACDVGQGDAFLVYHGQSQILIDAGPDNRAINCLDSYMPFWDRQIELAVLTHLQKDHYGGLLEVFQRFEVKNLLATTLESGDQDYQVLKNMVGGRGVRVLNPVVGQKIRLGLIYLDILHPSEQFAPSGSEESPTDPNDFSIVLSINYKDFDALFTGDIGPEISDKISQLIAVDNKHDYEYIKVPHHGSRNGLSQKLVKTAGAEIAVISVGRNQWGHPHKEVLDMLRSQNIQILRTDEKGNIEVISDGNNYWVK